MKKEDGNWTTVEYTKEKFDKEMLFTRIGYEVTINQTDKKIPLTGIISRMELLESGNVKVWIHRLHDEETEK